ncbi:DUF342 domain-containing protein [Pigmentiphaga aceris]|nr:FapA family protein [Pigmentiphaga aceris]
MSDSSFHLMLEESTRVLYAEYLATPDAVLPNRDALVQAAAARGWSETAFADPAVTLFLNRCHTATEPFRLPVGEVRDGTFSLELDADHVVVLLELHAPQGGKPVRLSEVREAITKRQITYGLKQVTILDALRAGHCKSLVIAEGTPPVPGMSARFVSLLDELKPSSHDEDENALIDYRNLSHLLLVSPGAPLMRRVPAVQGLPGTDVFGHQIPPPPVSDQPFPNNLAGTKIDEEDPNLLRAAIAGVPKLAGDRMTVDPVVSVEAVDLTTGNINFDGSLQVRGDITAGMEVRVTGDIAVRGTIEAAHVEAGGDVKVNGGIIGVQSAAMTEEQDNPSLRIAHIVAGGSIKARFMVSAFVSAGKSISAEREIRQCEVLAGESVVVGRPGSRDGSIIGGKVRALKSIRAGRAGAPSGTPTMIQAGVNPHAAGKLAEVEKSRVRLLEEKSKLDKLMEVLDKRPDVGEQQVERIRGMFSSVVGELFALDSKIKAIQQEMIPTSDARIEIFRGVQAGVTLHYAGHQRTFMEEREGGKAVIEKGHIVLR